jgi:hypothetical protein
LDFFYVLIKDGDFYGMMGGLEKLEKMLQKLQDSKEAGDDLRETEDDLREAEDDFREAGDDFKEFRIHSLQSNSSQSPSNKA